MATQEKVSRQKCEARWCHNWATYSERAGKWCGTHAPSCRIRRSLGRYRTMNHTTRRTVDPYRFIMGDMFILLTSLINDANNEEKSGYAIDTLKNKEVSDLRDLCQEASMIVEPYA